jgi:hypothetical protein
MITSHRKPPSDNDINIEIMYSSDGIRQLNLVFDIVNIDELKLKFGNVTIPRREIS